MQHHGWERLDWTTDDAGAHRVTATCLCGRTAQGTVAAADVDGAVAAMGRAREELRPHGLDRHLSLSLNGVWSGDRTGVLSILSRARIGRCPGEEE